MQFISLQDPFYQAILNSANMTIIATRPDGIITFINHYALELLEYNAEDLINKQTPAIIHDPAEVKEYAAKLSSTLGQTVPAGFETFVAIARTDCADEKEWTYITRTGKRVPVYLSVTAIHNANNELTGFLGIGRDITELKKAEAREKEMNERFRQLAEAAFEAIVLSEQGLIIDVNPEFERMFNCPRSEALGRHVLDFVADDSKQDVIQHIDEDSSEIYEARVLNLQGKEIYVEICGKSHKYKDKTIRISAVRDISERKFFEQQLRNKQNELEDLNIRLAHLANTDELTQLPNKRALTRYLERFFDYSRRHRKALSVLIFDIDHFKMFNDTHGHLEGDKALQQVADASRGCLRNSDYIARFGGEEFVIILPETALQQAAVTAEKLRRAVEEYPGYLHPVTVSVGVATLSEQHHTPSELLNSADMQLYRAKHSGRNRCAF